MHADMVSDGERGCAGMTHHVRVCMLGCRRVYVHGEGDRERKIRARLTVCICACLGGCTCMLAW